MHPSIKIISLFALAWAVHVLHYPMLLTLGGVLGACLLYYRAQVFLRLLKRVRLLLLFLLVIFAFNTPGEYLPYWPFELAPTYEGLQTGLLMALRLGLMLAGLALLLQTTSREYLITGFYLLAYPLRYLRLSPERFAARLWLTLHYVEHAEATQPRQGFFEHLGNLQTDAEPVLSGPERIQLTAPALSWRDAGVIAALAIILIYLL